MAAKITKAQLESELKKAQRRIAALEHQIPARKATKKRVTQETLPPDEMRYHSLFEESPLSLWEEDFSAAKKKLSELKESGVTDLRGYLYSHPEFVIECASLVQVLDVNKATLRLFEAERKEDLLKKLDVIIGHENIMVLADELLAFDAGQTTHFWEGVNFTTRGRKIFVQLHLSILPGYEESLSRVVASITDVTKRCEAEDAQKRAEIYYRALFEQTHNAVFILDLEGNHLAVNQRGADMLGYKFHEILSISVLDTSAEQEKSREVIRRLLKGEHIAPYERIFRKKDGSQFPVEINLELVKDVEGKPLNILSVVRDITQRKLDEVELRKSEERYRTIAEDTPAMVCRFLPDGTLTFINSFYCDYFDTPYEKLVGTNLFSLIPETEKELVKEKYLSLHKEKTFITYEYKTTDIKGRECWQRWTDRALFNENGDVVEYQSIGEDITERKEAEQQLAKNEARFRALIANTGDLILVVDAEGNVIFASPSTERIFGYLPEEVIGRSFLDWVHSDDLAEVITTFQNQKETPGVAPHVVRVRGRHKDGTWRYVEALGTNLLDDPSIMGLVVNIRDVTEQKRGELEKQALYEIMQGMALSQNLNEFLNLVHFSISRVIRAENLFVTLYNPLSGLFEDAYSMDKYDEPMGPSNREGTLTAYIFRTGTPLLVNEKKFKEMIQAGDVELVGTDSKSWLGVPLKTGGKTIGVMAIQEYEIAGLYSEKDLAFLASISGQVASAVERKQAEEKLRESEKRFTSAFENAAIGMSLVTTKGRWLKVNPALCSIVGYTADELTAMTFQEITHPDDLAADLEFVQQTLEGSRQTYQMEKRYFHKDGRIVWALLSVSLVRSENGEPLYFISQIQDVTERKRIENVLRESEEKYRLLIENASEALYVIQNGLIVFANPMFEKISQVPLSEVIGSNILDFIPSQKERMAAIRRHKLLLRGKVEKTQSEYKLWLRSGEEIWVNVSEVNTLWKGEKAVLTFATDITSNKLAADKLRASEARLNRAQAVAQTGSWNLDYKRNILTWSAESYRIFGITPETPLTLESFFARVHPDDLNTVIHAWQAATQGAPYDIEHRILVGEEVMWVRERAELEADVDGSILRSIGTVQDITERKLANEALREAETKYRNLVERLPVIVYTSELGENGVWTYVSPQIEHLLGFTAEEWMADSGLWYRQIHPEDRDRQQKLEEQASVEQGSFIGEYRIFARDGRQLWIRDSAQILPPQSNGISIVQGVIMDITERKLANETLQRSEQRYRSLFEDSPISLWEDDYSGVKQKLDELKRQGITDFEAYFTEHPEIAAECTSLIKILDANKISVKLFNAKNKEELLANTSQLLDTKVIGHRGLINFAKGLTQFEWEGVNRKLTGELMNIKLTWSVAPGHEEDLSKVLISIMDITELKRVEAELRETKNFVTTLLELAPISIYVHTLDDSFSLVNFQWEEDTQISRNDAVGHSLFEVFPPELAQNFQTQNRMVAESGSSLALEEWVETPRGRRCYYTHKFPLRDTNGVIDSVGGISLDITERKQADEKLSESERRYRNLFESSPIPLWEEDFSRAKKYLDDLKQQGITDFHAYFKEHPGMGQKLNDMIEVLDVNQATLIMYHAKDKKSIIESAQEPGQGELDHNHEDFIAIAEGRTSNNWDGSDKTVTGEPLEISLSWSVVPGYEDDYSKVIITTYDITERKLAKDRILESEQRYRGLFENSPISLWEEDFSAVKQKLDEMRHEGIIDFEAYFSEHPHLVSELASLVKVLDVNRASLKLFKAEEKNELLSNLGNLVTIPGEQFKQELIQISKGITRFEHEAVNRTLTGETIHVYLTWSVAAGYETDLSKVIISLVDITERKRSEAEINRQLSELETLYESGLAISRLLTPKEIAQKVIEVLDRRMNWHHIGIRQYQPETNSVTLIGFHRPGVGAEEAEEFIAKMNQAISNPGQGLSGWVTLHGQPLRVANIKADERYMGIFPEIQSGLYVPLQIGERVIGSISVESEMEDAFTEHDERLLMTLAGQAAIAIENANLFEMTQKEIIVREQVEVALQKQTDELLRLNDQLEQRVKERTAEIDLTRKRLELATDTAGLGIWEWDVSSGSVIWDNQMFNIYGISPEIFNGKIDTQMKLMHPEDRDILMTAAQDIKESKRTTFKHEYRILHQHGDTHTLFEQGVAVFGPGGTLERIIGIVNDVTPQKQAEQDLRESEAYARLLFDAAPDPVSVADPEGILLDVNRLFEQQHQVNREDIQYRHLSELNIFPDEQLSKLNDYLMAILEGKDVPPVELDFHYSGGGIHTLEMHSYPIEVKGRQLVLSTSRDITIHKKAEESLRFANTEMERALRMKDEFLANMSHELRTPLNAVLGMSESLEEQIAGPLNEKQLKYIRTIGESGHHLLELINDILDLSKIEAGRMELNISQVSVSSLCDASLRMIKEQAQKKNQQVSLKIDPEVKVIMGDERRLKQSLVNLLSNAVKFTPNDMQLGVEVKGNFRNQTVTFTVWDEGIGIAAEELTKIFKPFVQLDAGLTREFSGTGLGLVLVAQMVRLHGGSVSVESKEGRGSRFSMTLPWVDVEGVSFAKRMEQKTDTIPEGRAALAGGGRILIVEDTDSIVLLLSEYLRHKGFQVMAARNGMEGVMLARKEKPDLILMDVMMPVMDGVEATKMIRAEKELQEIPIIALTALAMPGDRERCLRAGMNAYLSKPVQMKELESLILKYLHKTG